MKKKTKHIVIYRISIFFGLIFYIVLLFLLYRTKGFWISILLVLSGILCSICNMGYILNIQNNKIKIFIFILPYLWISLALALYGLLGPIF